MKRALIYGVLLLVLVGVLGSLNGVVTSALFAVCTGSLGLALVMIWQFRRAGRTCYELWRSQSPDHKMRYELDAEGFTVRTSKGSSRHAWDAIRSLAQHPASGISR